MTKTTKGVISFSIGWTLLGGIGVMAMGWVVGLIFYLTIWAAMVGGALMFWGGIKIIDHLFDQ